MSLFAVRKGERRDAWAAFLTLFALIASHSLLETTRDALFLARIPAAHLPWVSLAIAALSLALVQVNGWLAGRLSPRRTLSLITLAAAAITAGLHGLLPALGAAGLYTLYVWSGLLAAFVLVHFWQLVGDRFTITQAKRLYGFIGAGSVLGAIAGSGAASLLSRVMVPEALVLVSALGFAVAGLLPWLFPARAGGSPGVEVVPRLRDTFGYVAQHPYARRMVGGLFVATLCLTVSDFVFKSMVAERVPRAELAALLGSVYFFVNVLSLVCQLGLVAWLLRRLSLGAALGVLPALLIAGGAGVLLTGSLAAVIALRAADGSLRHSLHRTTAELLVLPFGADGRRRVKAFADLIAQRGGQVVASLAVLAAVALGASPRLIALGVVVLAAVWLAAALALRAPYVALFRARLKAGRSIHLEAFAELDVASLEALLRAMESDNDREVLAALDVFVRENKAELVPALLLHHPSEPIVLEVLGILTRSGRESAVPIIDRISDHPSARVRAAALAARSVLRPDPERLRRRLAGEASAEVRAAIVANLAVAGALEAHERDPQLAELLEHGSGAAKLALAEAIGRRAARGFEAALLRLVAEPDKAVRRAAVTAMGSVGGGALVPSLIDALRDEVTRAEAERALATHGPAAFEALRARFEDRATERSLRWRIPAAMATCSPLQALSALAAWLPQEPDGGIRFSVLVVLERLTRLHPTVALDRAGLSHTLHETIARAYLYLDARLLLRRGVAGDPARQSPVHDLLHDLLRDKEGHATGRLFRIFALLHPAEDFVQIHRGLSAGKELRATSIELIESILREPVRSAVLGLVDDGDDEARLARAGAFHRSEPLDYPALLERLAQGDSRSVREVVRHHQGELGLAHATDHEAARAPAAHAAPARSTP